MKKRAIALVLAVVMALAEPVSVSAVGEGNSNIEGMQEDPIADEGNVQKVQKEIPPDMEEETLGEIVADGYKYNVTKAVSQEEPGEIMLKEITENRQEDDSYYGSFCVPPFIVDEGQIYNVTEIAEHAFEGISVLKKLVIPDNIQALPESLTDQLSVGVVYCNIDSYAETFLKERGMSYKTDALAVDTDINSFHTGETAQLIVTEKPDVTNEEAMVKWTVDDEETAQVTEEGKISFLKPGSVNVTAELYGLKASLHMEVTDKQEDSEVKSSLAEKKDQSQMDNVEQAEKPQTTVLDFTFTRSNNKVKITGYTGSDSVVTIPDSIEGNPVTSIGVKAFYNQTNITQITIPSGVTMIEGEAFSGCSAMQRVNLNGTLSGDVAENAFSGCTAFKTLYLGSEVNAFYRNSSGTYMGEYLEEILVDEKNTVYQSKKGVLYEKNSKTGAFDILSFYPINRADVSYVVPSDTTRIKKWCFTGIKQLEKLTINGRKLSVGESETVNKCISLRTLILEEGVEYIEADSISECNQLERVVQKGELKHYSGRSPFKNCSNITTLELGPNVTKFVEWLLEENVKEYAVDAGNTVYSVEQGVLYKVNENKELVSYPAKRESSIYTVEKDTKLIGANAFYKCASLEKIDCSELDAYSLEMGAVYDCDALLEINYGRNVTEVGSIISCDRLEEIVINPVNEVSIPDSAFYDNNGLKRIQFVGNVSEVKVDAIDLCKNVETIVLGSKIRVLGYHFTELDNLQMIVVEPENRYFMSEEGILFDKKQKELLCYPTQKAEVEYTVPDSVEHIRKDSFSNNDSLVSISMGTHLKSLEDSAFYHCQELSKVVLKEGLESIGRYAFSECSSLTEIDIPDSVKTIGNDALRNCTIISGKGTAAEQYALANNLPFIERNTEQDGEIGIPDAGKDLWNGKKIQEVLPVNRTYIIENGAQLAWISEQVSGGKDFFNQQIVLAADIDMQDNEWLPIGNGDNPFRGSFDGKGHTVSNFKVTGKDSGGLFGAVSSRSSKADVVIKNIQVKGVHLEEVSRGGALIGYARTYAGTKLYIQNCKVNGTISGEKVGGLVGILYGGYKKSEILVSEIQSACTITSNGSGGGIIGCVEQNNADDANGKVTIKDCKYSGKMSGQGRYGQMGGIVSTLNNSNRGELLIQHCRTEGQINASQYTRGGGIIAEINGQQNIVRNCVNYANLVGGYYVGGIAGYNSAKVFECGSEGYIQGTAIGASWGGIVGNNSGLIKDCYSTCIIGGSDFAYNGGITGSNNGTIENCYTVGGLPAFGNSSVSVSMPGAMASIVGGTTLYSFFDRSQDETQYLYGTFKTQDIINDEEKNITYSGGMTTSQMKESESYRVWDFSKVWEFDSDYAYGYPMLTGIKDIAKKHPDTTVKPRSKDFKLEVVDQDDVPLEGVKVIIGTVEEKTNAKGIVTAKYSDKLQELKAEKTGYQTYYDNAFTMNKTQEYKIRLVDLNHQDSLALNSAILSIDENRYELLTQTKNVNKAYRDATTGSEKQMMLTCKPILATDQVAKYELCQNHQSLIESSDGVFQFVPSIFAQTKSSGKETVNPVSVKVYDLNGSVYEEKINLTISDEQSKSSSISFGKNMKFTLGSDVPVLGGTQIELVTFDFPVNVVISEEKWKVGLNLINMEATNTEKVCKVMGATDNITEKMNKLKKYMDKKSTSLSSLSQGMASSGPKISVEVVGYTEGDMPMDFSEIKLQAYIKLSVKWGIETSPVPFLVLGAEIKGNVQADGEITFDAVQIKLSDGKIKVGGDIALSAFVGAGVPYLASAGVYGTGKVGLSYYLFPKEKAGMDEMYMESNLKLVLRVLGTNAIEYPLFGSPWKGYLYSRDMDEYDASIAKARNISLPEALPSNLGESKPKMTGEVKAGTWTGEKTELQKNAYSCSQPILMQSGSDTVMLFVSNMEDGRAKEDESVLFYSVYNSSDGSWNTPKPVDDNGTADFNPVVSGSYVAWNDSKSTLKGSSTYNALGEKQEVAVAKYNSTKHQFEQTKILTDNNDYESTVNLMEVNGIPIISWIVNSSGDVFGFEGSGSLYISSQDGAEWNTIKAAGSDHMVLGVKPGKIDGRPCCVYIVDENDNILDNEGQTAYLTFSDTGETKKLSDTNTAGAWIVNQYGQNKIIWIDSMGTIYSQNGANGETVKEAEESGVQGTIRQLLEAENGDLTILFIQSGDNCSNAYRISYNAAVGGWSDVSAVTAGTDYVESISGTYTNNQLMLSYNQRKVEVDSGDLNGTNSIYCTALSAKSTKLTDLDISFFKKDALPSANLPMTVSIRNSGLNRCENVRIQIKDQGSILYDQMTAINLAQGEQKDLEITVQLPAFTEKKEYQMIVTPEGGSEVNSCSAEFEVGGASLKLDKNLYCVNGKYTVIASVENIGLEPANGILEFFDYSNPDIIYESYDIVNLRKDERLTYDTKLEGLDWASFTSKTIGLRIVSGKEVISDIRMVTFYQDHQITADGLVIDKSSVTIDGLESSYQLQTFYTPQGAAGENNVIWTSSHPEVVSVNETGLLTSHSAGTAIITAKEGKMKSVCRVTVGISLKQIQLNKGQMSMAVGGSETLKVSFVPENTTGDKSVTWSSSNSSVVSVDKSGKVTAKAKGTAIITAKSADRKLSADCKVTVISSVLGKTPNLSVVSAGYDKIKLSWKKIEGAEGYVVYRATSSGGSYSNVKSIEGADTLSYTNTGMTTGKTYYYKVRAYATENGKKVYSSYSSVKSAKSILSVPDIKTVSGGSSSVKVSWNKIEGANGYYIYRASSSSGTYSYIKSVTGGSTQSYTDLKLSSGKTYYYKVRAYRNVENIKVYSGYSTAHYAVTATVAPSINKVTGGAGKAAVSWGKISGASGYELYMATSSSGKYTKVTTVGSTTTSYTKTGLSAAKTYYFKLRTYRNGDGGKVYSNYSAVRYGGTATATPSISKISGGSGKITVSWGDVSGESQYELYMATSSGGTYSKIASLKANTTSYIKTGLSVAKTCYFKVRTYRTVNGSRIYSNFSSIKYGTTCTKTPSISKVSGGFGKATVSWGKVSGASGYELYMATSSSGKYTKIATAGSTATSYTKTGLSAAKTYYFKLRAYRNGDGVKVYSGYSAARYGGTATATPSINKISGSSGKITVSWGNVSGESQYELYMASSSSGAYSKIASLKADSTSYTKTGLSTAKTYYFKVRTYRTVNGSKVYSNFSSIKYGTTCTSTPSISKVSGGTGKATVSWSKVSGASGYELYMATSSSGKYTKVATAGSTATSYTKTGLSAVKTYYFKLRAYRNGDGVKVYSGYSVARYGGTATATPLISKISGGSGKITVSWGNVSGESQYELYMATSSSGTYSRIASLKADSTSYTKTGLSTAKTYYFKVRTYRTVNGNKVYSNFSSIKYGTTCTSTPVISAVKADAGKVTVKWEGVSGASGYLIYMATSSSGTYSAKATIKSSKTTSAIITGLTSGKTYYFKMRTYRTSGGVNVYSSYSKIKSCQLPDYYISGDYQYRITDTVNKKADIIKYLGDGENLIIPEVLDGYIIEGFDSGNDELIGAERYAKIKTIQFPSTLKYIYANGCIYMESLEEVVIPEGTEWIGRSAFYGCVNLKRITIPRSVTEMYAPLTDSTCIIYCLYRKSYAADFIQNQISQIPGTSKIVWLD